MDIAAALTVFALIAIMLISGVPTLDAGLAGNWAASPVRVGTQTPALPSATTPKAVVLDPNPTGLTTVPAKPIVNYAALCLLGADPNCGHAFAPSANATAPFAGSGPSSWTEITPPTGAANPAERILPAMVYDPSGHDVVLFGGYGYPPGSLVLTFFQDTWSFVGKVWTPVILNTSCTATTCPSPRAGAMIAYDPTENGLILFGGFNYSASRYNAYNDTWMFSNGSWTNITSTVGPAPPARFEGSMTYDPSDNYILLFGGSNANGDSFGDTWTFSSDGWTNITSQEGGMTGYVTDSAPEPRAGAAISNSPSGYVMLYGGEDGSTIIENYCNNGTYTGTGLSSVAWWFYDGLWTHQGGWGDDASGPGCEPQQARDGTPPTSPTPSVAFPQMTPPCGRIDAALGWSPKNERFVLYGGLGPSLEGQNGACMGPPPYGYSTWLNDTWVYSLAPGGGFLWYNATDAGDPPGRTEPGYASDFTDNYFDIFGGTSEAGLLNETWRFYEVVHAKLSGPQGIDTANSEQFQVPFLVTGYGGSGDLTYSFSIKGLRNSNTLSGTGCGPFTDGSSGSVPYDGQVSILCQPTQGSYNIYRLTVDVVDTDNVSDFATANWTFTVTPPESMNIVSEYISFFYTDVDLKNTFSIYATVDGGPATSIAATLGGSPITFTQRSGAPDWWDANVDMGGVAPGAVLMATAQFSGWTLNATDGIAMVESPAWLLTLFHFSGATQSIRFQGSGPYNKTFTINESYSWNLGQALGFNLPIPLAGGDYSLVPSLDVTFSATSFGNVSLLGKFSLTPPAINFGAFSLKLSASLSLQGSFAIQSSGSDVDGVQWLSASATVSVAGDFSGSVPLYGFEILGVTVGFVLNIELNPSITLEMILAPTTETSQEIISGIGVMIQQFLGTFTLPLSVAVSFGIGFASVGIGGTISVALGFHLNPGLAINDGWVNGSVFVQAQALFWSDSWTLASGTIYSWNGATTADVGGARRVGPSYNNGTNTTWVMHSRYYVSSGYDANVWRAAESTGPAISDIYPYTEVSGAAAYNGGYLFYSNDNASLPVQQGLGVSGLRLDPSTNALSAIPSPTDPGFVLESPRATTLPDGNVYVLWDALPASETSDGGPNDLTSFALQGAEFYPANQTWGPVHTWSSSGLAESYGVDATETGGTVVVLLSNTFLVGSTTPERLVEFNLTSGQEVANVSATGLSEVTSVRGASGEAVVQNLEGNYSVVDLASGATVPIDSTVPANVSLISASFAAGSDSTLVLLYRGNSTSLVVLFDLADGQTIATLPIGGNTSEAQALESSNAVYLFVRTSRGIDGWAESSGTFRNLTIPAQDDIASYGVVQAGSSILLYSLVTAGNASAPTKTLTLTEIGALLSPVPVPSSSGSTGHSPSSGSSSPSTTDYLLYLGIGAGLVVLVLAVVAVVTRKRPPTSPTSGATEWQAPPPIPPTSSAAPSTAPSPEPPGPPT